jgi:hypothetical protein
MNCSPMFRYFSLSFFAIALNMLTSCNEKVNLTGDFKETAVVFGLLNHADSLHYVKITRAFIGPGSALDIAKIPDSSYFNQVAATVQEVVNGNVTRTWILRDTVITGKNTNGAFYAPDQKVFYFKTLPTTGGGTIQTSPNPALSSLNPDAIYRFKAIINNGEFEVSAQTNLVNGITTNSSSQNFSFKFADNPGSYISTGLSVSNTGTSFIVNASLGIRIAEYQDGSFTEKTIPWNIGEAEVLPNTARTFSVVGKTFYEIVRDNVTINAAINKRTLSGIQVTITGGAEELYNYMTVNKPSSSLAQNKPSYTNLTVTNGKRVVGIFSSRQTLTFYKPFFTSAQQAFIRAIDKKSTRELCQGPISGNLFFCSNHPGDNVVNQQEPFACP